IRISQKGTSGIGSSRSATFPNIYHKCHNHPSGSIEPSQDDVHLTLSLKRGLALIDVRVLDHIIVGDGEPLSMVEQGWIVA
ncbi:JAB domain-containing protein, partial [Pseudomonas monteilii]|uniref:JAB domain-containing protein n=1 Tax=Pseudomonas monteilii TaxID=76759 RepID=UPI0035263E36